MMVALKFVHVGAIALWAAALILLPWLMGRRAGMDWNETLHDLHRMVRALYVRLASPMAVLAIASGTALILMRPTQAPWFTAKLAAVGVMAMLHVIHGLVIPPLFRRDGRLPTLAGHVLTIANLCVVLLILWLVLWRPDVPLPGEAMQPGGLKSWLQGWWPGLTGRELP